MKWYKYNINDMTEELYRKYLGSMCKVRRERVEKKLHREDRLLSVAGEMLIKKAVAELYGKSDNNIVILEDKCGAPYVENMDIHISISHSGDYAVCAVADTPVGIDIERVRPIGIRVAKRTFSTDEMKYLGAEGDELSEEALVRFYEIWTAKEAYAKHDGMGIKIKDTVDTTKLIDIVRAYFDGYVISIYSAAPKH